jgi:cold shock CspA family protein
MNISIGVPKMIGTITFFYPQRGYGFLTVSGGEQFFFHITQFKEKDHKPVRGAICSFALGKPISENKKPQAIDVRFAKPEEVGLRTLQDAGFLALIAGGQ